MPQLFLASSADKVLDKLSRLAGIVPDKTKVAFVQNAAVPEGNPEEMFWVQNDKRAFEKLGYPLEVVDITKFSSPDELRQKLEEFQLIHVCGGNTLYINYLFHQTGLNQICRELVNDDRLIYTATSAGSMIVAPNLKVAAPESLEEDSPLLEGIDLKYLEGIQPEHYAGLSMVPFMVMPHANDLDFQEYLTETVKKAYRFDVPLLFLHDHQAVWVENGKFEIVEA
jgi:peptidase E